MKECSHCRVIKAKTSFNVSKATKDGLCHKCKECAKKAVAEWRIANPNGYKKWADRNRAHLAEKGRKYREKNKIYLRSRMKLWSLENRDSVNARVAKRNAMKRSAYVAWANESEIKKFYTLASIMTEYTGQNYEVDHIYPLKGATACGLHCECNLQILLQADNIRKLNHMPEGLDG